MVKATGMKHVALLGLAIVTLGLAGCAGGLGGGTYERGEARRAMTVEYGTVEAVRAVRLEGTKTAIGPAAGAVVGGIAGSGVGGGRGQAAATVIGAVAGGVVGGAIEEGATRQPGVEVTVRMQSGQVLAVVQADEGEAFRPGERVRVLRDGGTVRVTR